MRRSGVLGATRNGPGPRSGYSVFGTGPTDGIRRTSDLSSGTSTTAGSTGVRASECFRLATGPSWTSGSTSTWKASTSCPYTGPRYGLLWNAMEPSSWSMTIASASPTGKRLRCGRYVFVPSAATRFRVQWSRRPPRCPRSSRRCFWLPAPRAQGASSTMSRLAPWRTRNARGTSHVSRLRAHRHRH